MNKRASEVLWDQLPVYFRPVMEFQEIVKAHSHGVDQVNAWMIRMRDNFYIGRCDEQTLIYYEELLGINRNRSLSLEERRSVVLMRYNRRSLYTLPMLKGMPQAYHSHGIPLPTSCTRPRAHHHLNSFTMTCTIANGISIPPSLHTRPGHAAPSSL